MISLAEWKLGTRLIVSQVSWNQQALNIGQGDRYNIISNLEQLVGTKRTTTFFYPFCICLLCDGGPVRAGDQDLRVW